MSAMSLPPLVPPFNYALVEEGLHRGAYPTLKNFRFLRRLRLSTIISLTPEEPNVDLVEFCTAEDISLKHISVEKFQESVTITAPMIAKVINLLVSTASLPVYIHCLDGANNTSLVIAVLRKLQNWKTSAIFAEFSRFSHDMNVSPEEAYAFDQFKEEIKLTASKLPPWLWGGRRINKHSSIRLLYREEKEPVVSVPATPSHPEEVSAIVTPTAVSTPQSSATASPRFQDAEGTKHSQGASPLRQPASHELSASPVESGAAKNAEPQESSLKPRRNRQDSDTVRDLDLEWNQTEERADEPAQPPPEKPVVRQWPWNTAATQALLCTAVEPSFDHIAAQPLIHSSHSLSLLLRSLALDGITMQ